MLVTVQDFKEALVNPLKKTIEQHKAPALFQFSSRDDLTKQWDRSEGLIIALNHIESTYNSLMNPQPVQEAEILPPQ